MSKICLLGDTHISCRNGDKRLIKFFEKVYGEWFFKELEARGIKEVIQLGDLFDKRTGNDSFAVSEAIRYFFKPLCEKKIGFLTLLGNHDIYFKESLEVNSPEILLSYIIAEGKIEVYKEPATIHVNNKLSIDIIPWICKENEKEVMEFIKNSESQICVGHFELEGFPMYRGVESHGGMSPKILKKYKQVFSGHFHSRSSKGNITYIGTPCEMTWNDWDDPRGFYVLDTETLDTEFVKNPFVLHKKIVYNDEQPFTKHEIENLKERCKDKFVKLIVEKRSDFDKYEKFVAALNESGLYDLKISEDLSEFTEDGTDDDVQISDTIELMNTYVDTVDTDKDKDRIKKLLKTLYTEALEME